MRLVITKDGEIKEIVAYDGKELKEGKEAEKFLLINIEKEFKVSLYGLLEPIEMILSGSRIQT